MQYQRFSPQPDPLRPTQTTGVGASRGASFWPSWPPFGVVDLSTNDASVRRIVFPLDDRGTGGRVVGANGFSTYPIPDAYPRQLTSFAVVRAHCDFLELDRVAGTEGRALDGDPWSLTVEYRTRTTPWGPFSIGVDTLAIRALHYALRAVRNPPSNTLLLVHA